MSETIDGATQWALNNADTDEGRAHLAAVEKAERIRRAREPKRFIIRRVRRGLWVVRDQARPHWAWTAGGFASILGLLPLAARDHGPWDGAVRVKLRKPETDEGNDWGQCQ